MLIIASSKLHITFSISIISTEITDITLNSLPAPPDLTGLGLKRIVSNSYQY